MDGGRKGRKWRRVYEDSSSSLTIDSNFGVVTYRTASKSRNWSSKITNGDSKSVRSFFNPAHATGISRWNG
jgi:hypothetical protein